MHSYQQGRRGIRPAPSRPRPLPPGMGTVLCKFYPSGACTRGESCLYRHTTSPDKNSSAAGKNFAPARRYVQHPQATAGAAPSTPSPSRRSVRAPPISSGGRERAHAPTQLTPIPGTSRGAYAGGHGGQTDSTSNNANGAVKDDGSARKSCPTSSAPKHGGKGKTSSSRRSTSPVKKYRRGLNKAFGAASAAAAGQPDMSCWAPASDQPYMDVDDKIGRDNVQIRPSDEDLTKPVAVQDGIPTATNTNATGTNTITNAGDDMTMTCADDREGVTVVGNDPSADGHNGTNHDYDRAPQAPTFNSKPSSKGTRDDDDDDDDEEEEQDNFLAKYWHESIQMSIFTHEDVAEILKKSGKAQVVVVPRARKETHSSVQGEKAHEQPMPDDDDDSKDGTISINVDNNVSNQGTDEPTADKVADTNGADKDGVTDATVGTGTAEQEDAKDDQGTNINKTKAIVVRYDVDTVDPKRKYCRCFCPPGVTQAKIDLPCPNFDNCSVLCCPYEHKTRDTFEIRMAERGLSMDDLFMGVHDEKSHIPYDYNDEEGRISPRVEVNTTSIMNVLCKMTSPSGVSTDSPSSEDTFILCQPVASADTSATTSSITSSDVEDFGRNPIECVADLYCYENGEILFLSPPSIPNDPRTKEELYWENPEAYSRESIERSKNDVVPPQSKTGTRLNPSATEFVPSTPTSTAKTTIVHVDVEGGKRQICTPAGKSDANSTPGCNLSFGTPSDGNDEASETKDDQKQLSNGTETGTTRANTKDSTSIPLLSKNSKRTGSKVPAQADAQATSTDECPYVAEKNTDPTPIDDAVNTDDTDAASEVAALSIPQDKNVPEQSRERSGAFDLSRNVSPPASSWSSPTRFQGTDKEVMVAIRKSDRELNFLAAMKSKPKKPDHPECDLPTSTTCASTPATPHDKKKKGKKRSGDTLSLKLRVRQERKPHKSHKKPIKVADDKKNAAADTIVSQEPPSQPKSESKPKPKPKFESSSGIKKKVKATTMATPTANVLSGSLSDPSNSSSSDNSTDTIPAEPSVDDCVKQMEEMQFSSSVISQTEADFRSRKPGSWTEGDLFGFACYLAKQEELNSATLEEPSLNEQNDTSTSSGRLASHAKLEGGLEKTKDAEDDPANQTGDKKKEATKKSKAAAKNRRRRKNKANKASESKTNTTPSEPAATPSKGGEGTRKKNGQNIPKKEVENRMEQDSKTPTSPELLEPADSGGRIDQSITEPSPEAKKRFRFWSAEQFHRDLYIKNLLKLISCEYCRLQHCESPEDTSSNDVLVEAFKKECTRVYETLYKYRTGPKSTVMVADDHPTLAGRRGRIVASDLAKHEFEVEFHRSKTEKIVNKTNTMSEVNDDDTYDLLDVDTDARSSFTRLKISAYDLALPESASNKGKGRNNKKAKNNKSTAQSSRPAQCTLNIEEDEAHDIHGFGMVVRASTLNELAGLKDSEILEHRLSEIMQTSDEQEEAAKVLEEQKEQAKIRDAEKREKQEIAKRFRQYEKQINGRSKKARRILSSGESKFMKGLKTKPEPPEKLYCDSDSLTSSIRNGFVDFLVTVHEGENEHEALELIEAIEEAQYSPNAVEYDESSETTRTCFFFEVDNHKIPLCIVDHKCQQIPDSREIPSSKKEEADVLMSHIMEQDQLDELCSETGLPKSDAYMLVNALIHFEMGSPQEFEIPHRVVRRLIKRDFLDRDFVREVFSGNEEVGHAQTQLFLRAASQRLSKRLSFDLSDRVRKLVHNMEFEGEQASDSDQDSDDSGSTEEQNDRPLSNLIDPSLFKKFCKVTGLNESDALQIVMLYLNLLSRLGKTPCQEVDRLSELCLGKLFDSGFLDNRLAMEFLNIDGGSMSGDMLLLTLVDQILQGRHKFSLSDLILADLEPHVCGVVVDDLHQCFIEELQPDDDKSTRADDEDEDEVEVLGEEDNEIVDASDDNTESSVDDEENNEDSV